MQFDLKKKMCTQKWTAPYFRDFFRHFVRQFETPSQLKLLSDNKSSLITAKTGIFNFLVSNDQQTLSQVGILL